MAKSVRAKREKKKDFVKKKIKVGKTLKKPQNETITTFKTKSIQIIRQLQDKESGEDVTSKRYSLEELLQKLDHPSVNRKVDACNGMKEIMEKLPIDKLEMKISILIRGTARCLINSDHKLRSSAIKLVDAILDKVGAHTLSYHFKLLGVHISCCLVSLHSDVRADSIRLLHIIHAKAPILLTMQAVTIVPNLLRILGGKSKFGIDLHKEFSKTSKADEKKLTNKNGSNKQRKEKPMKGMLKNAPGMVMQILETSLLVQLDVAILLAGILRNTVDCESVLQTEQVTPFKLLLSMTTPSVDESEKFILMSDSIKLQNFCSALLPAVHSLFKNFLPDDAKLSEGVTMSFQCAYALDCLLQLLHVTESMVTQCVTTATQCDWYVKLIAPIVADLLNNHFPFHYQEVSIKRPANKDKKKKISPFIRYENKPLFVSEDLNIRASILAATYRLCKDKYTIIVCYMRELLSDDNKIGLYNLQSSCNLCLALIDHFNINRLNSSVKTNSKNSKLTSSLLNASFECYKKLHPLKKQRKELLQLLITVTDADHKHLLSNKVVIDWCDYLLQEVSDASVTAVSPLLINTLSHLCLRGVYIGKTLPATDVIKENLSTKCQDIEDDINRLLSLLSR